MAVKFNWLRAGLKSVCLYDDRTVDFVLGVSIFNLQSNVTAVYEIYQGLCYVSLVVHLTRAVHSFTKFITMKYVCGLKEGLIGCDTVEFCKRIANSQRNMLLRLYIH
jgi:hypothetical protein